MIGRANSACKDGKPWTTSQHHLKDWKVMLWVVASLMTLVETVFSEEDNQEAQSDLQRGLRKPSWFPAQSLEQHRSAHTPWPKAFVERMLMQDEAQQDQWRSYLRDPNPPKTSRKNRKRAKSSHDCRLEKKEMRVRDLSLGYDSDEIVLFKYCVGTCSGSRKNYDLALKSLVDNGSISSKKISAHPCCRPTRYETVSFMDMQTTWHTIKWLSAANCSCVG